MYVSAKDVRASEIRRIKHRRHFHQTVEWPYKKEDTVFLKSNVDWKGMKGCGCGMWALY